MCVCSPAIAAIASAATASSIRPLALPRLGELSLSASVMEAVAPGWLTRRKHAVGRMIENGGRVLGLLLLMHAGSERIIFTATISRHRPDPKLPDNSSSPSIRLDQTNMSMALQPCAFMDHDARREYIPRHRARRTGRPSLSRRAFTRTLHPTQKLYHDQP